MKDCSGLLRKADKKGFDLSFMVDPLGFAGGLLLVWNKDSINLAIVNHNSQAIHYEVKGLGNSMVHLSFPYVRPNKRAKEIFWGDCMGMHSLSTANG